MKYRHTLFALATVSVMGLQASTETEKTAGSCLLKTNPTLEEIYKVQNVLNGHLENPDVKFEEGKAYNDNLNKVYEMLNDCIRKSEKPAEVLSDAKRGAINPIVKDSLQKISNEFWWENFNYYSKWTVASIIVISVGAIIKNLKK